MPSAGKLKLIEQGGALVYRRDGVAYIARKQGDTYELQSGDSTEQFATVHGLEMAMRVIASDLRLWAIYRSETKGGKPVA